VRRALPLTLLLGAACAPARLSSRAEPVGDFEVTRGVADVPVLGHRVVVDTRAGVAHDGELLAVDAQHVWVELAHEAVPIHHDELKRVVVELYPSYALPAGGAFGLGLVSTLSHGFFLVFSAPVWLLSGTVSAITLSGQNSRDATGAANLAEYARFPQGLPPALWHCATHPPSPPPAAPEVPVAPEPPDALPPLL
jgi:hypothetical protein